MPSRPMGLFNDLPQSHSNDMGDMFGSSTDDLMMRLLESNPELVVNV